MIPDNPIRLLENEWFWTPSLNPVSFTRSGLEMAQSKPGNLITDPTTISYEIYKNKCLIYLAQIYRKYHKLDLDIKYH